MRNSAATLCILLFTAARLWSNDIAQPEDIRYRTAPGIGIEISLDGGESYEARNSGLPLRVVYPFTDSEYRTITAVGLHPDNPMIAAVSTSDQAFLSTNAGEEWKAIPLPSDLNRNINITAIAPSPHSRNGFLLGTSFNGFYETRDGGESWSHISDQDAFTFIERGAGFNEEISGLAYDKDTENTIYFELGFGNGIFRTVRSSPSAEFSAVEQIPADHADIQAAGGFTEPDLHRTRPLILSSMQRRPSHGDQAKLERINQAADRTGIFLNSYQAQPARLEQHIEFIKSHGMNSVVIDFKDDMGWLTYDSSLPMARRIGAVSGRFNAEELISTLHEHDIYVIARLVVFKDQRLFAYDDNRYAVWDREQNRPWGDYRVEADAEGNDRTVIREHWVDTFSEDVWSYNVDIARELEDLGVDEIQFDYIRIPSDGPVSRMQHRFSRPDMRYVDALASFLRMARQELSIPIGTDVFGFNAWYRTGYLGQDIEKLSEYIDVISPMSYPSHFDRQFHSEMEYFDRAQFIYEEGSHRAVEMVGDSLLIRPYVQAFLIGSELNYSREEYSEYLVRQLTGVQQSPASGFTLWNMSGRYYMATEPLIEFTQPELETEDN